MSPRPTRPARGTVPGIWLVGEAHLGEDVASELASLDARIRTARELADLGADAAAAAALVIVPPLKRQSVQRAVRRLRAERAGVPVFAVVPDDTLAVLVRRLYAAGASAVFQWPSEAPVLAPVLMDLLGLPARNQRTSRSDRRLERSIRARLRPLGAGARNRLRASVRGGVAYLSGAVDSLWRKGRAIDVAAETAGIRSVVSRALAVHGSGRSDRDVTRAARSLLRGASSIESSALSVSVSNGHAVVAGPVESRLEAARAAELLANVRGVRSVANLTTEARRRRNGGAVARRLREALPDLMPRDDVHVEVLGGLAVLSGRVSLLSTRRRVARIAEEATGVERVIDKIQVEPTHRDAGA